MSGEELQADQCGAMGLCERRKGHEGTHTTSVERALAAPSTPEPSGPLTADQCGALDLCEKRRGHEGTHTTSVARARRAAPSTEPALDVARRFLTPMEHLPSRLFGDPDDMPRCVACHFLLTPRTRHRPEDCPVAAYLARLAESQP